MSKKEMFDFIHKQANALSSPLIECDEQKLQESKKLLDTFTSTLSGGCKFRENQKDIFTIAPCSQSHRAKATLLEALRIYLRHRYCLIPSNVSIILSIVVITFAFAA